MSDSERFTQPTREYITQTPSLVEIRLNDEIVIRAQPGRDVGFDVSLLFRAIDAIASSITIEPNMSLSKQKNTIVTQLNTAIHSDERLDSLFMGKRGVTSVHYGLLNNFEFSITGPCVVCGEGLVTGGSSWTEVRDLYFGISTIKELVVGKNVLQDRSFFLWRMQKPLNGGRICRPCINERREIELSQEREETQRQEARERQVAIEKAEEETRRKVQMDAELEYERNNQPYIVIKGDLEALGEFGEQVSSKIADGYTIWGSPLMHNGIITQALMRKEKKESTAPMVKNAKKKHYKGIRGPYEF